MKMTKFFSAFAIALMCGAAFGAGADLNTDDAALIKHIKATDFVFRALLGKCNQERISRVEKNGLKTFEYSGRCRIRPTPEEDCQAYIVHVRGTVDTPEWATAREVRLELQCSA